MNHVLISDLIGVTLTSALRDGHEIVFASANGTWKMLHIPDCCDVVEIEDIVGDLSDLVGSPILMAEESTNHDDPKGPGEESWTWTFYKLATVKGYVTIRWYGTSNGYYSETASFVKMEEV